MMVTMTASIVNASQQTLMQMDVRMFQINQD